MIFSSIIFLFYFLPLVLIIYYCFKRFTLFKNMILLAASLFFYAWGEPRFVLIMAAMIIFNYISALIIDKYKNKRRWSRLALLLAVAVNLIILFLFKYADFVISLINEAAGNKLSYLGLTLPIGISFFTFQAISYVIDVYRGNGRVQKNPFYAALYISFFPQLIAGPIVRYGTIDAQIKNRVENLDKFSVGVCRFIAGLGKKVLLSNNFAVISDYVFDSYKLGGAPVTLAWVGSIAYTLQILFDFSGYSDMAIGLGLMFGFKFEENFNYPYTSRSISEFWRRWHISLGNWFKEYVYFPLGGSRVKNMDIVIRNMLVVWTLTGIWHGAERTFLIWGLLNLTALVFERFINLEYRGHEKIRWVYTMFVVNIGWVIFRAENLVYAGNYLRDMFGLNDNKFFSDYAFMYLREYGVFFLIGIFFCIPFGKRFNKMIVEGQITHLKALNTAYPIIMTGIFLVCVMYLAKGAYNPFIYFNF